MKIGENFGIRLTYVGNEEDRLKAVLPLDADDEDY